MLPTRIAAIDVETTGLDPDRDRIVEIGVVVCHPSGRRTRRSWLVHPGRAIPESVIRVHGISDAMVRHAPPFAAIAAEVVATIGDATPLAYNAPFDSAFLLAELVRAGSRMRPAPWIDPLPMARRLPLSRHRLADVAAHLGMREREAHRALADAETALDVFFRLRDHASRAASRGSAASSAPVATTTQRMVARVSAMCMRVSC